MKIGTVTDMRMEHVGARAAYDHTIDMASEKVIKQVAKAKSKSMNALQTRYSRGRVAFKMLSCERTQVRHRLWHRYEKSLDGGG